MSDYGDIPIAHRHRIAIMAHTYWNCRPGDAFKKAMSDLAEWYETSLTTVCLIWTTAYPHDRRPVR